MNEYEKNLAELKTLLKKQGGNYDIDLIEKAYHCCVNAHKGQRRLSGEEYYMHPYSSTKELLHLNLQYTKMHSMGLNTQTQPLLKTEQLSTKRRINIYKICLHRNFLQ